LVTNLAFLKATEPRTDLHIVVACL